MVRDDLRAKRLLRVLPAMELTNVEVFGVVHRGGATKVAVRAVLAHLQAELPARIGNAD